MLKSQSSQSPWKRWSATASLSLLCMIFLLTVIPAASAQADFTLTATSFSPPAVPPNSTASSDITIAPTGGFTGSVALSCQVTPAPPSNSDCLVSPSTVLTQGGASVTITTSGWTPGTYTIVITGTGPTTTHTSLPLNLTVLSVSPQFTIIVQKAVQPTSVPAGNGSQATISVNPVNEYTGHVTLSCTTITPLVSIPPICSFTYPNNLNYLSVSRVPATVTLVITTQGLVNRQCKVLRSRFFYALWLPFPMVALAGLGRRGSGKRYGRALALLALVIGLSTFLVIPSCENVQVTSCAPNGITPSNTYTFTIVGTDDQGNVSSNTGPGNSSSPAVTLTVTAPSHP